MDGYLFDTVIFNRLLDKKISVPRKKSKAKLYATHIQLDELLATSNDERRGLLVETFNLISPNNIPTESALWGISKWGNAKWTGENSIVRDIRKALDEKNDGKRNNAQDALIAETAIMNELTLVTEDIDLRDVANSFGGKVIGLETFLEINS